MSSATNTSLSAIRQRIAARRENHPGSSTPTLPLAKPSASTPSGPVSTPTQSNPSIISSSNRPNSSPWRAELRAAEDCLPPTPPRDELVSALHAAPHSTQAWAAYLSAARAAARSAPSQSAGAIRAALLRLHIRATRILPITAANRHDPVYLKLWIELAQLQAEDSDDPDAVADARATFKLVKVQRIGLDNPDFYRAWASVEERAANFSKAARLRSEAAACRPLLPSSGQNSSQAVPKAPSSLSEQAKVEVSEPATPRPALPPLPPTHVSSGKTASTPFDTRPARRAFEPIEDMENSHASSVARGTFGGEYATSDEAKGPKARVDERPVADENVAPDIEPENNMRAAFEPVSDAAFVSNSEGISHGLTQKETDKPGSYLNKRSGDIVRKQDARQVGWVEDPEPPRSPPYRKPRASPRPATPAFPRSAIVTGQNSNSPPHEEHLASSPRAMVKHSSVVAAGLHESHNPGSGQNPYLPPTYRDASSDHHLPAEDVASDSQRAREPAQLVSSSSRFQPSAPSTLAQNLYPVSRAHVSDRDRGIRDHDRNRRDYNPQLHAVHGSQSELNSRSHVHPTNYERHAHQTSQAHVSGSQSGSSLPLEPFPMPSPESTVYVNRRPYLKLGLIGKGGSSKVFKVLSGDMKVYALKFVKVPTTARAALASYANEIALLHKLKGQSSIVQLHDAEVHKSAGTIHLVMEFGEMDLATLLVRRAKAKSVPDQLRRSLWQQMLEAVKTIHEAKIVHGDLKPANFVNVAGMLKLIDFGIAKAIVTDDTTKIVRDGQIGTPNYMAPEALVEENADEEEEDTGTEDTENSGRMSDGDRASQRPQQKHRYRVGRASDIWSLGCILYQMVYGRTPFAHIKNFLHKINCINDETYEIAYPPSVPVSSNLLDVLHGCLQRNPEKRMSMATLLAHPYNSPDDTPSSSSSTRSSSNVSVLETTEIVVEMFREYGIEVREGEIIEQVARRAAQRCAGGRLSNRSSGADDNDGKRISAGDKGHGGGVSLSRMTPTSSAITRQGGQTGQSSSRSWRG